MRIILIIFCLLGFSTLVWGFQPKSFQQQIPKIVRIETNKGWVSLHGIAIYKHYAHDIYAGAFYAQDHDKTPQAALNDPGPKRMLFLILSTSLPFQDLIESGLKRNNAPKILKKEQVRLSQFLQILDRKYSVGDVIVFDRIPKVGTQIMVNNLELGVIEGDEFYDVLLRIWMGRQPPSFKFREDLFSILNAPAIVN